MKTNKTVLPPVVKQEFAKRPTNHNNNNIPSHLKVPEKLPSAKKSPPPEIKCENIKVEGKFHVTVVYFCIQIIIKVFGLIKYFLSNKILTSPIVTLDAN